MTFQRLEDSRENVVRLDMMTTDTYPQIAGRLAQRLGLESWEYVRLYPQHQWMQKASRNHVVSGETRVSLGPGAVRGRGRLGGARTAAVTRDTVPGPTRPACSDPIA